MDYFELIGTRQSCRSFDKKAVEREKLVKCIEAARVAPSACDSQPWHFYVVTEEQSLIRLRKYAQVGGGNKFTDDCPALIVAVEEHAALNPAVAKTFDSQHWARNDIGLSVMQICLAATAQGLSTCIMGWIDENGISELLNLTGDQKVRLVIAVGYAKDGKIRPKIRKDFDQIVTFVE